MPYNNVPDHMTGKMDSCVKKVMGRGTEKKRAIAICYSAIMETHKDLCKNRESVVNSDKVTGGKQDMKQTMTTKALNTVIDYLGRLREWAMKEDAKDKVSFIVTKDASGRYRWVSFSSTAYKDRDGEIVSMKAQEKDCDAMTASGDYGVLRWWHMGIPVSDTPEDWKSYKAGKGIDLGVCDFSAMHGKIRVESGTFYKDSVAQSIARGAESLRMSIGFSHPPDNPDQEGTYDNIHTFERSLLPVDRESNPFTAIAVSASKELIPMTDEKIKKLRELLGDATADDLIQQTDMAEKAVDKAGVAFKADDALAPDNSDDSIESNVSLIKDMTADEFRDILSATLETVQFEINGLKTTIAGLQTAKDALTAEKSQADVKLKEVSDKITAMEKAIGTHTDAISTLLGDAPRSMKGYRASAADDTVTKNKELLDSAPKTDPLTPFWDFALGASQ